MGKLKNPLLSLGAVGRLTKAITFTRRRKQDIAEETPTLIDVKSIGQLSWRHMWQKAIALWHALSADEKETWESGARARHMTGYAWFMSQALRPNPGLYLPLQGGTMTGDIDMGKNRLLKLPSPTDSQEPWRLQDYITYTLPYLLREGARVYHTADQTIPDSTPTALAFNSERYDTDTIHDNAVFNSRLTCKTAGKYVITGHVYWAAWIGGKTMVQIRFGGLTLIAGDTHQVITTGGKHQDSAAIYDLAVNDYVELVVFQNEGNPRDVLVIGNYSPEFAMQRMGP